MLFDTIYPEWFYFHCGMCLLILTSLSRLKLWDSYSTLVLRCQGCCFNVLLTDKYLSIPLLLLVFFSDGFKLDF